MINDAKEFCSTLKSEIFFDENWNDFLATSDKILNEILEEIENLVQFDDPIIVNTLQEQRVFRKVLSFHTIIFSTTDISLEFV